MIKFLVRVASRAMLAAGVFFSFPLFSDCLSPQTPVLITTTNSVVLGTNVAGNPIGFVLGWRNNMNQAATSFSSNQGQTWSSPATFSANVISWISLSGQTSKFLASWVTNVRNVSTSVSLNGVGWSAPVVVSTQGGMETYQNYLDSTATNAGFMVVWSVDVISVNKVRTSFSSDGITWNAPVDIPVMGFQPTLNKIAVAGNSNGFLVGFTDDTLDKGYVSFSSNQGASWSSQVQVAATLGNNCTMGLGANQSGFLAAWIDSSNKISTSFSSDNGATWSAPVQIPLSIAFAGSVPRVSANGSVFVVAWTRGFSLEPQASCTTDNGATWSDASIFTSTLNAPLFDVSVSGSHTMFTWHDNGNNAISVYSPIAGGSPVNPTPPSTMFRQISPNKPGSTCIH